MIYPVITMYQPWASWVVDEIKLIETRTHNKFRKLVGQTILIHAGLTNDDSVCTEDIVFGAILGSAFVYGAGALNKTHQADACIECESVQRYGLFLKDIIKFKEPIPEKGEMGIWHYDLENRVKAKPPKKQLSLTI